MIGLTTSKQSYKEIVSLFKKDPIKHANKIVDVLKDLEEDEPKKITGAVAAIHKIFIFLLKEKIIRPSKLPDDVQEATEKYSNLLFKQYEKAHKKLISLLSHKVSSVRELALCSIVKLIQAEGRNPTTEKVKPSTFPHQRLDCVIRCLVSNSINNQQLISRLQEYTEYQDFIFFTIKSLSAIVKRHKRDMNETITEIYISNVFAILEQIDVPIDGKFVNYQTLLDDVQSDTGVQVPEEEEEDSVASDEPSFVFKYPEARQHLNYIWMQFIQYSLTSDIYRKCLVIIPDKAMHHLKTPVKLTDFFMQAYNLGGAFSLLALQGIFILITKHNLDYPDFYTKLYSLLEKTIFHAKYKARFFMLLSLFLSSTHLPEYLMAAFVKRLSRLSLVAPSDSQVLIIKFISNMLVRCPSLKKLINNPDVEGIDGDPFDDNELDPLKSKATNSCLWEIATLKSHWNPVVSKNATFVDRNPPDLEFDLAPFVETSHEEVFQKAAKIHMKEIPTTFYKPVSIFNYKEDQLSSTWSLL